MTTELPVDLHKQDRRVQSNTYEFIKMVSLVFHMLKKNKVLLQTGL